MFIVEDKILDYPSMTVLEDLLTRDNNPNEYSFTPYSGCAKLLKQQFKDNRDGLIITAKDIINDAADFKASKAKPNDDGVNRDYKACEASDNYHRRLEDIPADFVYNYVLQAIIGFKKHDKGLKQMRNEMKTVESFYDEENDEYIVITDTLVKEEHSTSEEILQAREKLPYLLKQLHEGSILKRGSLLSFIIAAEKIKTMRSFDGDFEPRYLVNKGVYRVDKKGNPTRKFVISDNTGEPFRSLVAWIHESQNIYENHIYTRAKEELLRVLSILDIDIKTEDCTWYTEAVVCDALCTYLPTNTEYLRTYGLDNKKLSTQYSAEEIINFSETIGMEKEAFYEPESITSYVDEIVLMVRQLHSMGIWKINPRGVKEFLDYYNINIKSCKTDLHRYDVSRGILELAGEDFFLVDIRKIKPGYRHALLTISGKLVLIEDFDVTPRSADVSAALYCFEKGGTCEFTETYFSSE